jgi:hypothetical protein
MARIVLLALAAAVFPTLIACVAIMISRPEPRRLLLAFYAGGLIASVAAGVVLLAVFEAEGTVLGDTASHPSAATSIVLGMLALLASWAMASRRGRARLDSWRGRHHGERRAAGADATPWAERHLGRANAVVAFVVGAAINLPGPFYVLALGEMATGGYSDLQAFGLILLFNAIMFTLLEVPLVGYLVRPQATGAEVARLAAWLNANGLKVTGWLVGAVGVALVVQGIAAAV